MVIELTTLPQPAQLQKEIVYGKAGLPNVELLEVGLWGNEFTSSTKLISTHIVGLKLNNQQIIQHIMCKNVLITGATGMVGRGVLLECLKNSFINSITLIGRSNIDIQDFKIKEIIVDDFMNLASIKEQLKSIDGCFHCMGVSSVGLSEEDFSLPTFEITKRLADICYDHNPKMTFNYVSGAGTDSTEKGRIMWARVKGKTENYILNKGFEKAYMFRPGLIIPENGIKSRTKLYQSIYNIMRPFYPVFKKMKNITTTTNVGKAMINTIINPPSDEVYFENNVINKLAK